MYEGASWGAFSGESNDSEPASVDGFSVLHCEEFGFSGEVVCWEWYPVCGGFFSCCGVFVFEVPDGYFEHCGRVSWLVWLFSFGVSC